MKLFCTLRSPYARKVRVIAIEKKITLDLVEEDLVHKSAVFLKANPIAKVPTLLTDEGQCFCDSPIICEYLDTLHDDPIFIPRSTTERLIHLNDVSIADGLMDRTVGIFMERFIHGDGAHEGFIQKQEESVRLCLTYFEERIELLSSLNMLSVAMGCAIGYVQFRLPHLCTKEQYPQLMAWYQSFNQRQSMQETMPVG